MTERLPDMDHNIRDNNGNNNNNNHAGSDPNSNNANNTNTSRMDHARMDHAAYGAPAFSPDLRTKSGKSSASMMGLIQDKIDIGMAKLRSDDGVVLDVAIIKATLHQDVVPKEKHVRTLKIACSGSAPRQQVSYVINGLTKRVEGKGWLVTLKALIVYHRLMREVDPSFQDEVIKFQERTGATRLLRLETFADHANQETWDFSAWIRVYSVYLDERLAVFRSMRFDPELESTAPTGSGGGGGGSVGAGSGGNNNNNNNNNDQGGGRESKLKSCPAPELLERLPQVQKLLSRLIACVPEGSAQHNPIVLQACTMVLREVRAIYRVVCEGVINLADKFFEMERSDALKGLDLYRENAALNDKLNNFFAAINDVPMLRGAVQMPNLQSLPSDFLATMEEYVRDAPKGMSAVAAGPTGAPPSAMRTSTIARQGATTSAAITGTAAAGGSGLLKIAPPGGDPAAAAPATPAPAPPPVEVDLLGDDFPSPGPSPNVPPSGGAAEQSPGAAGPVDPMAALASPAATSPPQSSNPYAAPQANSPYGAPPGAYPGGMPSPQQPGMPPQPGNPFPPGMPPMAGPTGGMQPPMGYMPGAAATMPHGYGMPPMAGPTGGMPGQPGFNPFGAPPMAGPTGGMPPMAGPTGGPVATVTIQHPAYPAAPLAHSATMPGHSAGFNPFGAAPASPPLAGISGGPAMPLALPAPPGPFNGPVNPFQSYPPAGGMSSAPTPTGTNPFGGGAPVWGSGPPQGTAAWGQGNITAASMRASKQDPLNDLGDLFGKPPPVNPQSLRDLKQQPQQQQPQAMAAQQY